MRARHTLGCPPKPKRAKVVVVPLSPLHRSRSLLVRVGCLIGLSGIACTPSYWQTRQSQVYFERCYAADLSKSCQTNTKTQCWTRWLRYYAEHQPLERRLYVQERLRQLKSKPLSQPRVLNHQQPKPQNSAAQRDFPKPPRLRQEIAASCVTTCYPTWIRCLKQCRVIESTCKDACAAEYRFCIRGCS